MANEYSSGHTTPQHGSGSRDLYEDPQQASALPQKHYPTEPNQYDQQPYEYPPQQNYNATPREIQIIAPAPQFRRFGNAAALGLITFGICTVQQCMMQAGMSVGYGHGIAPITGQAIAVAGLAQFCAGLWQIANGETFEGAAFTSFGAAWIAKGLALIPGLGVAAAAQAAGKSVNDKQKGIVSLAWSIWVFILLLGNVKSTIANIIMFVLLNLEIDFDTAAVWTDSEPLEKAAGWFGFFCGLMAMYNAATILLNEENFWFNLPVGHWYKPPANYDEEDHVNNDLHQGHIDPI